MLWSQRLQGAKTAGSRPNSSHNTRALAAKAINKRTLAPNKYRLASLTASNTVCNSESDLARTQATTQAANLKTAPTSQTEAIHRAMIAAG